MINTTLSLNDAALMRRLRALPTAIQDKVIVKSVRHGANVIKKEARKNTPTDDGELKASVKSIKARKSSNLGNFVFVVKATAPHAHLIELGTDERTSTRGKKLTFTGRNGNTIYIDKVAGVTAVPFLGKAYDDKKNEVIAKFKERLQTELSKF
ncbi:HK97-gp10 family putative phage morphogenesis protein [Algoriphagus aquimarinus]|uniref:HK97-gp10 family putative phage morphogenesis protein n=1 Tax=Algoriphagus aquimarinus TaxID=237018 RepID=UPI0030DB9687|tara:strand:- start:40960 stop:41418 length:459 start_codon:yes stop_codon:yes gene_type:complete